MSVSAPPPAATPAGRPIYAPPAWITVLIFSLVFVTWDAIRWHHHLAKVSAAAGVTVRPPLIDAATPTGWADGRRQLVYPGRALDGTHWVMQTQQMLASGEWRLRHVGEDNAPNGRALHWGSLFRWWLGACAWIDHLCSGAPLGLATERAAVFANPALLALLLLVLVPWTASRFGTLAAAFLSITLIGMPPLATLFAADNPDHHGLIQVCASLGVFALLAGGGGWIRPEKPIGDSFVPGLLPTPAQARRAFLISALFLGFGLWVSAVTLIPVLVGIGLGALAGAWSGRKSSGDIRYEPALWRRWGLCGCLAALAAYLIEYFPHHLGWRLEVNHPVYALAWLAAGEILAQLTGALAQGKIRSSAFAWPRLGPALLIVSLPAGLLLFGGTRFFSAGDRFFWALLHDYVPECQSLWQAWQQTGFNYSSVAQALPMLALLVCLLAPPPHSAALPARALTAIPAATAALVWLLSARELRWWLVGFGFIPFVLLPFWSSRSASPTPPLWRSWRSWAALLLFVPGLIEATRFQLPLRTIGDEEIQGLVERDLAHWLRQRTGAGYPRILAGPATTSRLIYFGNLEGLGTSYWENLEGLQRAAAIYAAPTAAQAHDLIRAAGLTHLVFLSWDDFSASYIHLHRQLPATTVPTGPAFILDLLDSGTPPPWLEEISLPLPDHAALRGQSLRVFEVTDRTSPGQVFARQAHLLLDHQKLPSARLLRPALEGFSGDLAAQIALARLGAATNDSAMYAAAMNRIEGLHEQEPRLEPADHVRLATLLLLSDLRGDTRLQLSRLLQVLDEPALRRLTPPTLAQLLALAEQMQLSWPEPRLHDLARQLLPGPSLAQ